MAKSKRKQLSVFMIAFLAIAAVFLALGLGTLGSVQSVGNAYELYSKRGNSEFSVVFELSNPKTTKDGKEETTYLRVKSVYLNVAQIYGTAGKDAEIVLTRGTNNNPSGTSSSYCYKAKLENVLPETNEEGKESGALKNAIGNWIAPFDSQIAAVTSQSNLNVSSSYRHYKLTSTNANILVNEIVFVGEEFESSSSDAESTGRLMVIPAKIEKVTLLNGETQEQAEARAAALLDAQRMPNMAQSSFSRLSETEAYTMMSLAEMRMGNTYESGNVYHGDSVSNSFGLSILAFGTLIFGMSPFGLRFFPMLASFGVLMVGFFFAKKLFRGSEKAGLAFAVVYALCNFSFGLGHLGTPLMLGVFFATVAAYTAYCYCADGIRKKGVAGVLPLILSGLCAAAAICVNGAFVIPAAGVVGLFAVGFVRQLRQRRVALDAAIAEAEELESQEQNVPAAEGEEVPSAKAKVASVLNEYSYRDKIAPAAFFTSFFVGVLLMSLLFLLPVYFVTEKIFAMPESNIFLLMWKSFAGGFVGYNDEINAWAPVYTFFRGTGETYAVTHVVMNVAAWLAGLAGIAFAIYRIVIICKTKEDPSALASVIVPLAGLVLCLVTAAFAKGAIAFIMLSYVFAFLLAGGAAEHFTSQDCKFAKAAKSVCIAEIVLLAVCFLVCAVFTFSLPLPAVFMGNF